MEFLVTEFKPQDEILKSCEEISVKRVLCNRGLEITHFG